MFMLTVKNSHWSAWVQVPALACFQLPAKAAAAMNPCLHVGDLDRTGYRFLTEASPILPVQASSGGKQQVETLSHFSLSQKKIIITIKKV